VIVTTSETLVSQVEKLLQNESLRIDLYQDKQTLMQTVKDERVAAALYVVMSLCEDDEVDIEPDEVWLDGLILQLDANIQQYLDVVLHHPAFQALESRWRSVDYLVQKVGSHDPVILEVLDCSKSCLMQDFEDACDLTQSSLYHHIYHMEYDMPGGDPMTAMITDYTFDASRQDIHCLTAISRVAELGHCPLLANISPTFFDKTEFTEVLEIGNLARYFERADYLPWAAFRESEAARYIALFMPRFLLRLAYGDEHPCRYINYEEGPGSAGGLWGAAAFAFAGNMIRSFVDTGWLINVRGPESGGKVSDLPMPHFGVGHDYFAKAPTEVLISESKELALAEQGFIPLSYYKNSNFACFFSANTVKATVRYQDENHTANSRVNARLPYVLLISRLGHYLKVLQREVIGSDKNGDELAQRLNSWLQRLVTKMRDPSPDIARRYPLREGYVEVAAMNDNPGYYKVNLFVVPHFQVEGIDIRLSLVAKLPGAKE